MNNIYLVVGESGSGKTTITTLLEKTHNLKSIQSYTTRPPREENETGHTFVTMDEFEKLTGMVAFTEFCGNKYCATTEQVNSNDLYIIDPDGINYFRKSYHGRKGIKTIYVSSPIHTRVERMEQRGDEFSNIMERIVNDFDAFREMKDKDDFIVVNEDETKLIDVAHQIWNFIRECENIGE